MRYAALLVLLLAGSDAVAASAETPAQLLSRGENEYRAAHYAAAVDILRAAFDGLMSPAAQQRYIEQNEFPELPQVEESLVYLALANAKLGKDDAARDAVLRLVTAERIAPAYGAIPIQRDRAEFEALAQRLVPDVQLAGGTTVATDAAERTVMLRLIEERSAAKRAEIEKEAEQQIANAKKNADAKIAAATATTAPPRPAPATPRPAAPARPSSDPVRARYDAMARDFAAKSGGRYTVQLEIACETASITHDLQQGGDVWFVGIAYHNRPCYRVFRGHFATAADAQRSGIAGVVVREPAP